MFTYEEQEGMYVFTCEDALYYGQPILEVHHVNDGNWLFLCGKIHDGEDAPCVMLKVIIRLDPSIAQLSDLPLGKLAKRTAPGSPWEIL